MTVREKYHKVVLGEIVYMNDRELSILQHEFNIDIEVQEIGVNGYKVEKKD